MPEGNDTKRRSAGQSLAKSPITVRSRLVTAAARGSLASNDFRLDRAAPARGLVSRFLETSSATLAPGYPDAAA
jgi:hypothetical protein